MNLFQKLKNLKNLERVGGDLTTPINTLNYIMITQEAINNAEELARIDSFYIEEGYSKEKTSRRLDILDYFRRDNAELWDRNKNWLSEDINTYYNKKYFEVKYPNIIKTPLIVKWIKILTFDEELPQEKYQQCAEQFERFVVDNGDFGTCDKEYFRNTFTKIINEAKSTQNY